VISLAFFVQNFVFIICKLGGDRGQGRGRGRRGGGGNQEDEGDDEEYQEGN
jgi:hypothetical protein